MLILTEAGENIGLGHFTRCSAIADQCREMGLNTELAIDWNGETDHQSFWSPFSWEDLESILLSSQSYTSCLVDSYLANRSHFEQIADWFDSVFVIDDYHRMPSFEADLVINPNVYGDKISYQDKSIGGSDFIILRNQFKSNIDRKEVQTEISNIGISVGGNDYRNLLPKLIDCLSTTGAHLHVICSNHAYKKEIEVSFNECQNLSCYGFLEASEVANILNQVDVMISGGGQSLHELAYAGVPAIAICIDHDQELNINAYLDLGLFQKKNNWNDDDLFKNLIRQLNDLESLQVRRELSRKGKKLVDGKGVQRIVDHILNLQT